MAAAANQAAGVHQACGDRWSDPVLISTAALAQR